MDSDELRQMSLDNAKLAMMQMDWQKEILEKECFDLKPQQKKMIEELLYPSDSNPYWVETEYRIILKRVLKWGYYREEDREALNWARECYIKGNNWIK